MTAEGFIRQGLDVPYVVATRIEDVLPALEGAAPVLGAFAPEGAAAAAMDQL